MAPWPRARKRRAARRRKRVFSASVPRRASEGVLRLDDIESDLICEARHVAGDRLTALYEFELRDGERKLLSGRASVVLDAGGKFGL